MTTVRSEWLKTIGFSIDPFPAEARSAESDIVLHMGGFHPLVYYEEIRGNYQLIKPTKGEPFLQEPGPRFIFGGRGHGKTALRMKIFDELRDSAAKSGESDEKVLPVLYNDFEPVLELAEHETKNVTPRMHVERIVTLIVRRLVETLVDEKLMRSTVSFENLMKEEFDRSLLAWYIQNMGHFHAWEADRIFGRLEGFSRVFTKESGLKFASAVLNTAAHNFTPALENVVKSFTDALNTTDIPPTKPSELSMQELLEGIVRLCNKIGLEAVVVLVDDVDEPQYYGQKRDYMPAFNLIRSLLAASKLISIDRLVFKFFLPLEIRPVCLEVVRLDKFGERVIHWQMKDFKELLQGRLKQCADDSRKESLSNWADEADFAKCSLDEELTDFAKEFGSPRALVIAGNELLAEFFKDKPELDDNILRMRITRPVWNRARQRAEEVLR